MKNENQKSTRLHGKQAIYKNEICGYEIGYKNLNSLCTKVYLYCTFGINYAFFDLKIALFTPGIVSLSLRQCEEVPENGASSFFFALKTALQPLFLICCF